jgi:mannose-6-phosphate isomerase
VQGKPQILKGEPIDSHTRRYIPPFEEFEIDSIDVPKGSSYKLPLIPGPSIFLVQDGLGLATQGLGERQRVFGLKKGDVFFLPADTPFELSASIEAAPSNGHIDAPLKIFRAGVNDKVFSPPCIELHEQ